MSMFRNIRGKVAIITGSAGGLGQGIAETLAMEGANVVMMDKKPEVKESFEKIIREYSDIEGFYDVFDVSDEGRMKKLVGDTVKKFGMLDIIVNNAGMHIVTGNLWETKEKDLDRLLAVNFKGQFFGCKYAAIQMIKQKSGTIINIGSLFGKVGHASSAPYGASKAAVHTMTQSLALELAPYKITVNALCPGLAGTDMHWGFMNMDSKARGITFEELKEEELSDIPLGRYGYGKDYAGAIMWLASESGSYCTGQLININGGLDFT